MRGEALAEEVDAGDEDDAAQALDGQAALIGDRVPDLLIEDALPLSVHPGGRLRLVLAGTTMAHVGTTILPAFSVLSQRTSACRSSLMYTAVVIAQSSGPYPPM